MINFKDKTFCSTPGCENKCGRKMTSEEVLQSVKVGLPVSWHPFCSEHSPSFQQLNDALNIFKTHGVKDGDGDIV